MPKPCSLCASPRRDEIDAALVAGRDSLRNIAERFGTSAPTLLRHRGHVPERLALARRDAEVRSAESLAEKLSRLEDDLRRLLAKAEGEGDFRAAIAAVKTALDVVALLHKVAAEAKEHESDLLDSPEWVRLREVIVAALQPYPEAFCAVWKAVDEEAGGARRGTPRLPSGRLEMDSEELRRRLLAEAGLPPA